jgi:hypothetical protein
LTNYKKSCYTFLLNTNKVQNRGISGYCVFGGFNGSAGNGDNQYFEKPVEKEAYTFGPSNSEARNAGLQENLILNMYRYRD